MKRRLKLCGVWLSTTLCFAAMVGWGFGIAGIGYSIGGPLINEEGYVAAGGCGGLIIGWAYVAKGSTDEKWWIEHYRNQIYRIPTSGKKFAPFKFEIGSVEIGDGTGKELELQNILLPYWLLILLFAVPPAFEWRRRYVERRDQKFFEQIKKEKSEYRNPKSETNSNGGNQENET